MGGYVSPEYHAPERSGCFRPGLRLDGEKQATIRLTNPANRVAFFVRAEVTHGADGNEILPITCNDNYITVFPHEIWTIVARFAAVPGDPRLAALGRPCEWKAITLKASYFAEVTIGQVTNGRRIAHSGHSRTAPLHVGCS